jgi:hypothetical protein
MRCGLGVEWLSCHMDIEMTWTHEMIRTISRAVQPPRLVFLPPLRPVSPRPASQGDGEGVVSCGGERRGGGLRRQVRALRALPLLLLLALRRRVLGLELGAVRRVGQA